MREAAQVQGRTVLYVSHNMNTIRQLCSRCIVLSRGHVIFDGDVEEAIALYLNEAMEEETVFHNLSELLRPENSTNKVKMESFRFLNKDDCIYTRGEPICFEVKWRANLNIDRVRFRMIVRYRDDSPVGLVQSGVLGDFMAGEEKVNRFQFDSSMLADGKYFFSIAFYQSDRVGNSMILDHVSRAVSIDIVSSTDDKSLLNWEHRWWGSVQFPELITLE